MTPVPDGRCGYTWPSNFSSGDHPKQQSCCWRETFDDSDRCVWHADPVQSSKTLTDIRAACVKSKGAVNPACDVLDGANLAEMELGDAISFSGVSIRDGIFRDADLLGADFNSANLTGSDLANSLFQNADFEEAILHEANLSGANLTGANLQNALLPKAKIEGGNLADANLQKTDLRSADLRSTDFSNSDLTDSRLERANLSNVDLQRADLTDALAIYTNLSQVDLSNADLTGATVDDSMLEAANLTSVSLTNADLKRADFTDADLIDADLTGADLREADFTDADLRNAELEGADLRDVITSDALLSPSARRLIELAQMGTDGSDRPLDKEFSSLIERYSPKPSQFGYSAIGPIAILLSWLAALGTWGTHPVTSLPIVMTAVLLAFGGLGFLYYVDTRLPDVLAKVIPVAESGNQDTVKFLTTLFDQVYYFPPIIPHKLIGKQRLLVWFGTGTVAALVGHGVVSATTSLELSFSVTEIELLLWTYLTVTSFVLGVTCVAVLSRIIVIISRLGREFEVAVDLDMFYIDERLGLEPYGEFLFRSSVLLIVLAIVPLLVTTLIDSILLYALWIGFSALAVALFIGGQLGFRREIIRAKEECLVTLQYDHRSELLSVFSEEHTELDRETVDVTESVVQIRNEIKSIPNWPADVSTGIKLSTAVVVPIVLELLF